MTSDVRARLASLAMMVAAPAIAQVAPVELEPVRVTGSKTDSAVSATKLAAPLLETPQAVAIVTSDFIEGLGLRTVAEALNYSAGVRSQAFGSDTRIEYYQIRGFANGNFVKDGLVLYNSGAFLSWTTPVEGIERLEVLKGPSSALYGGGSAGGLVDIVTKRPVRAPLLSLKAGADQSGTAFGSLDAGGAISDTLAFRGVASVRGGDTQVDLAKDERTYFMGSIEWRPSDATSLLLRGSSTRDRSNRPTGFVPYAGFVTPLPDGRKIPTDLFVSDPRVDRYDRNQDEIGAEFVQRFGDGLRVESNARYGKLDLVYAGLFGQFTGNPVALPNGSYALNRGNAQQVGRLDNVTSDSRLVADFATGAVKHTAMLGFDYGKSTLANASASGSAPRLDVFVPDYSLPIPALGPSTSNGQTLDQRGGYVQDQMKSGSLVAVLSARHDRLRIATVNNAGQVTRGEPSRATYRGGVVWLAGGGFAPYANVATSFVPVIGMQAATGDFYRPETGRQFEVGLKFESSDVFATLAAFDIRRTGVLVADPRPGFPTNQSQGGAQRSRGGEFEVQARVAKTLKLTAALTAFDIQVLEGAPAVIGKKPTATPQFVASLFADWTVLPGLSLGAGVRHVGRSFADDVNTLVVPAVTVFDLAARYEADRFGIALNVSNVADKAYAAACPSAGTCYAGNLRRATLSLSYRL